MFRFYTRNGVGEARGTETSETAENANREDETPLKARNRRQKQKWARQRHRRCEANNTKPTQTTDRRDILFSLSQFPFFLLYFLHSLSFFRSLFRSVCLSISLSFCLSRSFSLYLSLFLPVFLLSAQPPSYHLEAKCELYHVFHNQ